MDDYEQYEYEWKLLSENCFLPIMVPSLKCTGIKRMRSKSLMPTVFFRTSNRMRESTKQRTWAIFSKFSHFGGWFPSM